MWCHGTWERILMSFLFGSNHRTRRINVTVGPHEKRMLITGLHTVADIYCFDCEVRALFGLEGKGAPMRVHISSGLTPIARTDRSFLWLPLAVMLMPPSTHARTTTDAAGLEVRGGV